MQNKPKERNSKKVFLIAGSTGGHAMPIFCLAKELKGNYNTKIFISGTKIEQEIFKGMPTVKILSGKFNRHQKIKNVGGSILLVAGFIESLFYLLFNRPDLIISKGGFLAVPILFAAKVLFIPYFTHESDSEIGLTNKIFMKGAKQFYLGFPLEMYKDDKPVNAIYSGQIVRTEPLSSQGKQDNEKPVIFITGGSQGSKKINQIVKTILPDLLSNYQIIHQTGQNDLAEIEKELKQNLSEDLIKNYHGFTFSIEENLVALKKSDLVIGRAGANTIGEIAALSRASILIPYPYAAADHQTKNARYMEKVGGAIVIKEENLTEKSLLDRIKFLMKDRKNLDVIGKNAHKAIKFDGLSEILNKIKEFVKE